ncbi:MAG TPA: hypothetical protein PKZ36_03120 [Candidatus Paceibacterota bacterium]|nr:hypothetical protein [Candidatus Paceibacterota bacterium]HPT18370.1 hypothetical protein [Candidatus Paceibacterota bacterium]
MKKIFIIIFIVIVLIFAGYLILKNQEQKNNVDVPNQTDNAVISEKNLCFYYSKRTIRGFYDEVWLRLNILGEKVTGEFMSYLAEKDSKTGDFEGTVGPAGENTKRQLASVWWNSFGEGMNVKEELLIEFGDDVAYTMGGEMVDRGDGVYIYKDKTKLSYNSGYTLNSISCESLDKILKVEKYVSENINSISTEKPVLGGSWHVLSAGVESTGTNSGFVMYEDGHIQEKAIFNYVFKDDGSVSIENFEVLK